MLECSLLYTKTRKERVRASLLRTRFPLQSVKDTLPDRSAKAINASILLKHTGESPSGLPERVHGLELYLQ